VVQVPGGHTGAVEVLPVEVTTPRLVLRPWRVDDAAALSAAIERSLDHLRPWMPWVADEPVDHTTRVERIRALAAGAAATGDAVYGAFTPTGGEVVGGTGLHRRRGPGVLEIGYWVHVDHARHGLASEMVAALTDVAFADAGVERVEIHHDRANAASRGVPAGLGYRFVGEAPDSVDAPGEEGIDCTWAVTRAGWATARAGRAGT